MRRDCTEQNRKICLVFGKNMMRMGCPTPPGAFADQSVSSNHIICGKKK